MDPLGLALENFNAVGQFRANDPDTLTPDRYRRSAAGRHDDQRT